MIESPSMVALASDYLTERRLLGFDLGISGSQITAFARFVDAAGHTGSLTTRIVLEWVQGKSRRATPFSWARRLEVLRPLARYLTRLDPATEFPDTAIFGRSHRRLAPHIYTAQEIDDLLAAEQECVGLESGVFIAEILRVDRRFDRPTICTRFAHQKCARREARKPHRRRHRKDQPRR